LPWPGAFTGSSVRGPRSGAPDTAEVTGAELTDTADFRPWIRLWAPNGGNLADTSALSNAIVNNAVAPVSGTYLILVSSFDSFFDGTGTYQLTVTHTP
jgi:hypothetical protein